MSNLQVSNSPSLFVSQIQDVYLKKNFQNIQDYFNLQNQLLNFMFKELSFSSAQTKFLLAHGLPTVPQDIIVTRITGAGKVTFRYDEFDSTNIVLDVDNACRIRFFYGTYWNFTSSLNNQSGDKMVVASGA